MSLEAYRDVSNLLSVVPLPDLVLLRQRFARPVFTDVSEAVTNALERARVDTLLPPGARIAVAVGSRGIASIATVVRSLVALLRSYGAEPFIVPAMGSHGGATPEGQRAVLNSLGVTEEAAGAPIVSSLDVDLLGTLPNGLPVYIDRAARSADGIVLVSRIKPHTDFTAPIESGLAKMTAIGLGKHAGALAIHARGVEGLTTHIPEVARLVIARAPVLFGLALLENAYDELAEVVVVPAAQIGGEQESALLERARAMMPRLPWDTLDVLVVDELGKNISGAGMDTNIIGRIRSGMHKPTATEITNIAVLDIAPEAHGNAIGLGLADFTTVRVLEKLDSQSLYTNGLTAGVIATNACKIPMILQTERAAVAAAIRACGRADWEQVRLARIKNTLKLEYILASPTTLGHLRAGSDVEILGAPRPFALAAVDALVPFEQFCASYR